MARVFTGRHSADVDGDFQYWRSFDQLDRYARNSDNLHLPAWKKWNKASPGGHVPLTARGRTAARRIGASAGDVPAVAYPGD